VHLLWSCKIDAPLKGLALAGERNCTLAWDSSNWLHLFSHTGEGQGRAQIRGTLTAAAAAGDGRSYAAGNQEGQVWCLAPDLMPRWERSVVQPTTAVALAALGDRLAVADASGGLHLFDGRGHRLWSVTLPRPLHRLAFVAGQPRLIGSADFGLVLCVDAAGQILWRDGLVVHSGALAVAGNGCLIALACYSDGLWCYDLTGRKWQLAQLAPCRQTALSYSGEQILTSGLENTVQIFTANGQVHDRVAVESTVAALALAPLGDMAWAGLASGRVQAFQVPGA
jgi:hypothetical protein